MGGEAGREGPFGGADPRAMVQFWKAMRAIDGLCSGEWSSPRSGRGLQGGVGLRRAFERAVLGGDAAGMEAAYLEAAALADGIARGTTAERMSRDAEWAILELAKMMAPAEAGRLDRLAGELRSSRAEARREEGGDDG